MTPSGSRRYAGVAFYNLRRESPQRLSYTHPPKSYSQYFLNHSKHLFVFFPCKNILISTQSFMEYNHPWAAAAGHHDRQAWRDEKTTQVKHNSHSSRHSSAVIRTLATLTLHYLPPTRPSTFQMFARRGDFTPEDFLRLLRRRRANKKAAAGF